MRGPFLEVNLGSVQKDSTGLVVLEGDSSSIPRGDTMAPNIE